MSVQITEAVADSKSLATAVSKYGWMIEDLKAGLVVAFMTIPMSMGVALASGFPAIAGIIASVVSGLVISFFAGSKVTIKGPAGGLSAIILGTVLALGNGDLVVGYQNTLAVVMASGVVTMLMALLRFGRLSEFLPVSTIHGMMAALGLLLVLKQVHVLFGAEASGSDALGLLAAVPKAIEHMNPKLAMIGMLSLGIMIVHNYIKIKFIKAIPAPLLVLLIVIPLVPLLRLDVTHIYTFNVHQYQLDVGTALVNLPTNTWDALVLPNFSVLLQPKAWIYVLFLAFAVSIESLLTTKAIDKIDPLYRVSRQNKDLLAIGIGNTISGLLGGLPVISESKRSVINIENGGKTEWSNFFHALFVLLMVLTLAPVIALIPLAALAGMLVYTGARLATPSEISKSYKVGKEQFLVFIVTLVFTLTTNFIVGIAIGIVTQLIIHIVYGVSLRQMFVPSITIDEGDGGYTITLNGPALFTNYFGVYQKLQTLPKNAQVTLDFTNSKVVDHTFLEQLAAHDQRIRVYGGQIFLTGLDYHKHLSEHPLASKRKVGIKVLSERQLSLKQMAEENGYSFDPRMVNDLGALESFELVKGYKIQYLENRIEYNVASNVTILYADIAVQKQSQTAGQFAFKMSVCSVVLPIPKVPDFILRKEGFVDTLFAMAGFDDIDFMSHPSFSYYYYLMGKDEKAIRDFFKPEIIEFFEQNRGFHVECLQNVLLIYKRQDVLLPEEVSEMLRYTYVLLEKFNILK